MLRDVHKVFVDLLIIQLSRVCFNFANSSTLRSSGATPSAAAVDNAYAVGSDLDILWNKKAYKNVTIPTLI